MTLFKKTASAYAITLVFATITGGRLYGAAEQQKHLTHVTDDSGNQYIQMKAYKNHDQTNCAASALLTTQILCNILEENPKASHDTLYNAFNNKEKINKNISPLNDQLMNIITGKIDDKRYQSNEFKTNVSLIEQMIGFKKSASQDAVVSAHGEKNIAAAQENLNNWENFTYTKSNIPTGFFMKDIMKHHFKVNMDNLIIYHDGIDEKLEEKVSFYYGNNDNYTRMDLLRHGLQLRNIITSIKEKENSFKVIIAPQEIMFPFSHYIVILIRNIGDNIVETITIDPGVSAYNQPYDNQTTFSGWLYQNSVLEPSADKKEKLGTEDNQCPSCDLKYTTNPKEVSLNYDDDGKSFLISSPCCNQFQCGICLNETTKKSAQGHPLCLVHSTNEITCFKALDEKFIETFNPRLKTYHNQIEDGSPLARELVSLGCELSKYKGGNQDFVEIMKQGINGDLDKLF
ncbi:hypothetical protein JKY79_01740 [Candidatus Babeliales bacterium]|nr:hypothetical protein [Candidatus Babeliales bacterium]